MNRELPDAQAGFRKGRGIRDQIDIGWIMEKAREFHKNIHFCFVDYTKAFVRITTNCGKFFKRLEYQTTWPASWEISVQVKKQQLELDVEQQTGSKSGKEYIKAVCCHPMLSPLGFIFNFYAEYILRNAGLNEAQAGIKIAGRNINNLNMQMTPPLWQKVKRN